MKKERRADPDAILASLDKEGYGKLTVFLGAAAGVGKTYAMLEAAQERMAEGIDVVAGWVETHGRTETEALLKGLTVIPPSVLEYRGKTFNEMDLDALLERKPQLALVDELAHKNIPGSRHNRRYQDVEELLSAGIDIYTTLNIQHLETLNDIVAQITEITVDETVPDQFIEKAAQIKLIDISPDELLQRLKEGKIYVPDQAREALRRFFRPGNISALRELALRYTAQRVDNQLENYMRLHGITGPWPTGERIMVCISPSPYSAHLIRTARHFAEVLKSEWLAVYVETPRHSPASEAEKENLSRNKRLAEELGAELVTLTGQDAAEEILEFARKRNISQIIIGKPLHSKIWEWLHGSIVDKVVRRSEGIDVHVLPSNLITRQQTNPSRTRQMLSFSPYVWALLMAAGITVLSNALQPWLGLVNIAIIYLLPVLVAAVKWGTMPSVMASLVGFLAFDILFVPPVFHLTVEDSRYLIIFLIYLLVSLLTGRLSLQLRQQIGASRQRETKVAALYSLSREIAAVSDFQTVLERITQKVAETIEGKVIILLPDKEGKLLQKACCPSKIELDQNEYSVATWVYEHGELAGKGTDTLRGAAGLYLPLRMEQSTLGVLGIRLTNPERYLPPEQRRLLEAFAGLAALAITRLQLAEKAAETQLLAESERLRITLFNSLSHDLRTPLASITGAVSGLIEGENLFSPEDRHVLLSTIQQEATRMNRYVNNLLDMARLESGLLKLNKEWCDVQDIIGVAVSRLSESLRSRTVKIDIEPDLPLVQADFILTKQVLVNLLDNALKYSDQGSEVIISARKDALNLNITVLDQGSLIPEGDLERIFDKFYRLHFPRQVSGTGLGLAICKGVVEAHGGKIWASNDPGGGVAISFTLPLDETPDQGANTIEGDLRK